jgi:salicylate hydroxylase
LAKAIEHTRFLPNNLIAAGKIFDKIRSPYYLRMYEYLDAQKKKIVDAKEKNPGQSFEESLRGRMMAFGGEGDMSWIYGNDIVKVWETFLEGEKVNGV